MKFNYLVSLFEDSSIKVYTVLGAGNILHKSGLYFPIENIYLECVFGRHKDLFDIIITEKYPSNFYPPAANLLKKYYTAFLNKLKNENTTKQVYFSNNSYYQLFKDMNLVRYNVDRGEVSTSCKPELMDAALTVLKYINDQIEIEILDMDFSIDDKKENDMGFTFDIGDEIFVPTTKSDIYKLIKLKKDLYH